MYYIYHVLCSDFLLNIATFLGGVFGAKLKACVTRNSVFNGTVYRSAMDAYNVAML